MIAVQTFEKLLKEGVAREELDPDRYKTSIEALVKEAKRAKVTAHSVPEWPRTQRATFFDFPFPTEGRVRYVAPFLPAALWVPEGLSVANTICDDARRFAKDKNVPELMPGVFNRIGINYMSGTMRRPAVIKGHFDPEEERGFIAVLSVDGVAEGTCDRPAVVGLYAGAKLCEALKIQQVRHGACANEDRMAYTFVDFSV